MKHLIKDCVNCVASDNKKMSTERLIVTLITNVILVTLFLFFGKYLWNNCLVKVVTIAKPVNSVWVLLGISILAKMILG